MGPLIPCFGLLVMFPLGFKARVGSALFATGGGICVKHSLGCTSGATPADLLSASMVAEPISSTYLQRHWWDLNGRPLAPWANAQPTELCRLELTRNESWKLNIQVMLDCIAIAKWKQNQWLWNTTNDKHACQSWIYLPKSTKICYNIWAKHFVPITQLNIRNILTNAHRF